MWIDLKRTYCSTRDRLLNHPIVQLELRRIRRKRWWPGRRFFMLYPALWGGVLGCIALVVGATLLESFSFPISAFPYQMAALVTGAPALCTVSVIAGLLSWALTWIAPVFTAISIVQERESGTFDLLRTTLLSERAIILGKLTGSLARLWPAIVALALLSPFQLIISLWGRLVGFSSANAPFALALMSMFGAIPDNTFGGGMGTTWVWFGIVLLSGLLSPWADLLLNAAVGQIVSVAARSVGAAIAATYGVIIALRVGLYLVMSTFSAIAMLILLTGLDLTGSSPPPAFISSGMAIPSLSGLLTIVLELAGAALLLWGAVEWLKRT